MNSDEAGWAAWVCWELVAIAGLEEFDIAAAMSVLWVRAGLDLEGLKDGALWPTIVLAAEALPEDERLVALATVVLMDPFGGEAHTRQFRRPVAHYVELGRRHLELCRASRG